MSEALSEFSDEEFDAWQSDVRGKLQAQVADAYALARECPCARHQGAAFGIGMYERMTRPTCGEEIETFEEIAEMYKVVESSDARRGRP